MLWVAVLVGLPVRLRVGYLDPPDPAAGAARRAVGARGGDHAGVPLGRSTSCPDLAGLQVPLAQAFLWLLLLHALDTPNRHGLLVLLVASLVLVSLAGVLSISMAIAPWLLIWGFAALVALGLAYRAELEELPGSAPSGAPRFGRAALAVPAAILACVLLVGFGVFMLVPVAGTNRALTFPSQLPDGTPVRSDGGLTNPSLGAATRPASGGSEASSPRASFGYFGFSKQLDTSLRGRPDDTLVMRVRASSPDFWRGQTFDRWNGRVWTVSDDQPHLIRGAQPIGIPRVPADGPVAIALDVDELVQTYYLEQAGPNSIFAASQATKVYFPDRTLFQNQDGTLRAGVRLDPGAVYTVVSQRPLVTPDGAARDPRSNPSPPTSRSQYAASPVATDRVRALAHTDHRGRADHLRQGRSRSSSGSAPTRSTRSTSRRLPKGADAVDQYLFVDRKGFCEQIGTALVVMLRELGIPARLAVGYTPGERNPFTGLYEVKASDAHAWAEVYFPGVGWQGFDPTATVPLAGDSQIDAAGAGALSYLSARLHIPGELLAGISIAAGLVGLGFAVRSLRRRPARGRGVAVVGVAAPGAARTPRRRPGPTARAERDHAQLRPRARRGRARTGRRARPGRARPSTRRCSRPNRPTAPSSTRWTS